MSRMSLDVSRNVWSRGTATIDGLLAGRAPFMDINIVVSSDMVSPAGPEATIGHLGSLRQAKSLGIEQPCYGVNFTSALAASEVTELSRLSARARA